MQIHFQSETEIILGQTPLLSSLVKYCEKIQENCDYFVNRNPKGEKHLMRLFA